MICVCETLCQVRLAGKAVLFEVGEVADFEVCPPHFRPMDDNYVIDFNKASEDELKAAQFNVADLRSFINETYKKKLTTDDRDRLISVLIDARGRGMLDGDPGLAR